MDTLDIDTNSSVFAYKGEPNDIYDSIKSGISRFGWSWHSGDNLLEDNDPPRKPHGFLLRIQKGDWVVHINMPTWGRCTAAKVIAPYSFDQGIKVDYSDSGIDYRHCIGIDKESIIEFDRNDPRVFPHTRRRLKLQGGWWQIHDSENFFQSLKNLRTLSAKDLVRGERSNLYHLRTEIKYDEIAIAIHKTHPGKDLEALVCEVFENVHGVERIKPNGSGWKGDYGADVIITYETGLPIGELREVKTLVVQVKSYEWKMDSEHAIEQVGTALNTFNADAGLIISTAPATPKFVKKLNELSARVQKPIGLLAGADFARFVMQFASDLLID